MADKLSKEALKHTEAEVQVRLSKKEVQAKVKEITYSNWQEIWNSDSKGRHLYSIQQQVGKGRNVLSNRKDDVIITRL